MITTLMIYVAHHILTCVVVTSKILLLFDTIASIMRVCFPLFQTHVQLTLMIYLSTKLHGRKTTPMCSQVMS